MRTALSALNDLEQRLLALPQGRFVNTSQHGITIGQIREAFAEERGRLYAEQEAENAQHD